MTISSDNETSIVDYLLGWMNARERKHLEQRMASDARLKQSLDDLQACLSYLNNLCPPVAPPPEVWGRIEAKTTGRGLGSRRSPWLIPALSGVTIALAVIVFWPAAKVIGEADLQPSAATAPLASVRIDSHNNLTLVDEGLPSLPSDKSRELWVIPAGGTPQAIGILPRDKPYRLHLAIAPQGGTLAISIEPLAGAPGDAPTGPVIVTGALKTL